MNDEDLRLALIPAIAYGNREDRRSPFLHGTTKLSVARRIMLERGHMYSQVLVRWPLDAVPPKLCLEFGVPSKRRSQLITDTVDDPKHFEEALVRCRVFLVKDCEVVLLQAPSLDVVQVYDADNDSWCNAVEVLDVMKSMLFQSPMLARGVMITIMMIPIMMTMMMMIPIMMMIRATSPDNANDDGFASIPIVRA